MQRELAYKFKVRTVTCGICGEKGHNKVEHPLAELGWTRPVRHNLDEEDLM